MEPDIESAQRVLSLVTEFAVTYGFQMLGAIIILLLGWYLARWAGRLVEAACIKARLDVTLSRFFGSLAKSLALIFVVIIALGKFGISIAPFIAALGAIAFGSTLALQGPLSNYGAGLTIILTRPFVVGDTIRVGAVAGLVEEVKLAYTQLRSEDGELITIPNKLIVGEIIHNSRANLLVEGEIGVSYEGDTDLAIRIILDVISGSELVVSEPRPQAGIRAFGDSAVHIAFRYWVATRSYHASVYRINQAIYSALRAADIVIPFPQRQVRIIGNAP